MIVTRVHDGEIEELEVSYRVDELGRVVCVCPPMCAPGCFDLRNRGFNLDIEVTVWPRRITDYGVLTTGGNENQRLKKSIDEVWLLANLAKSEVEFQKLSNSFLAASESKRQKVRELKFSAHRGKPLQGEMKKSEAYKLAESILGGTNKHSQESK